MAWQGWLGLARRNFWTWRTKLASKHFLFSQNKPENKYRATASLLPLFWRLLLFLLLLLPWRWWWWWWRRLLRCPEDPGPLGPSQLSRSLSCLPFLTVSLLAVLLPGSFRHLFLLSFKLFVFFFLSSRGRKPWGTNSLRFLAPSHKERLGMLGQHNIARKIKHTVADDHLDFEGEALSDVEKSQGSNSCGGLCCCFCRC